MAVGLMLVGALVTTPAWSATPATGPAQPQYDYSADTPDPAAMVFDAVIVRPLSFATTIAGAGLFVVSLPFSALGHNSDAAAGALVGAPARYTFSRPLGNFDAESAPQGTQP
ncbi:hypothetical protein D3260_14850 [Salinisphaera sp. Q1T1-3]|nr:hypothetical protein D3260_14850 [Salinisphaera sp. Q1T1-3]